jgi:hypothetical protein
MRLLGDMLKKSGIELLTFADVHEMRVYREGSFPQAQLRFSIRSVWASSKNRSSHLSYCRFGPVFGLSL